MAKYCNMPAYIINSINWINLWAEPKQQAQSAYNKWTWQPFRSAPPLQSDTPGMVSTITISRVSYVPYKHKIII